MTDSDRFILQLAERIYLAHEVLANLAERKRPFKGHAMTPRARATAKLKRIMGRTAGERAKWLVVNLGRLVGKIKG